MTLPTKFALTGYSFKIKGVAYKLDATLELRADQTFWVMRGISVDGPGGKEKVVGTPLSSSRR